MRFSSFIYLVGQGLHNLRANRLMTFASMGVLTVCMLLIGAAPFSCFFIAAKHLDRRGLTWYSIICMTVTITAKPHHGRRTPNDRF